MARQDFQHLFHDLVLFWFSSIWKVVEGGYEDTICSVLRISKVCLDPRCKVYTQKNKSICWIFLSGRPLWAPRGDSDKIQERGFFLRLYRADWAFMSSGALASHDRWHLFAQQIVLEPHSALGVTEWTQQMKLLAPHSGEGTQTVNRLRK